MKKVLSVTLAALICVVMVLPSFALGQSTEIKTELKEDVYEISYPADTQIPWNTTENFVIGDIEATKMSLSPNKRVSITVSSENGFNLAHVTEAKSKIAYSLLGADQMQFLPGDYGKKFPLSVTVAQDQWDKACAGEYKDILTFNAVYETV